MRQVEMFRALRTHDEAKSRLEKAEKSMESVRNLLHGWVLPDGTWMPRMFGHEEAWVVKTISEMKAAYYAYEELFIDRDYEQQLADQRQIAKSYNEIFRRALEQIVDPKTVEIVGDCPHKNQDTLDPQLCPECRKELKLDPSFPEGTW